MIEAIGLEKNFDGTKALDGVDISMPDQSIYGLVGSNGSGKSTFMRLISGVYMPDGGTLSVDGQSPFENVEIKDKIAFVCDDPYFFPQSTMDGMADFYEKMYSGFDLELYRFLCNNFQIQPGKKIQNFSKGMKRQVSLILGLSCSPKYLLLDEAFDGLDPVMRGALRKLLSDQIAQRDMTVLIASHNLRELEDICDHIGLMHQGHIIFKREIDESKLGYCKVQAVFASPLTPNDLEPLQVLQKKMQGSIVSLIVKGSNSEIKAHLEQLGPLLLESIPLTLEEVFIHEMEAVGYDYNQIIF